MSSLAKVMVSAQSLDSSMKCYLRNSFSSQSLLRSVQLVLPQGFRHILQARHEGRSSCRHYLRFTIVVRLPLVFMSSATLVFAAVAAPPPPPSMFIVVVVVVVVAAVGRTLDLCNHVDSSLFVLEPSSPQCEYIILAQLMSLNGWYRLSHNCPLTTMWKIFDNIKSSLCW